MLLALLLVGCAGGPATPPENVSPDGVSDVTAIRGVLASQLGTPEAIVARMLVRVGPDCAVVVDPEDPGACDPETTCRATALTRTADGWGVSAIGVLDKLPTSARCPGDNLAPWSALD